MEDEIKDKLDEIYENIKLEVKWRDFGIYDVFFEIQDKKLSVAIYYDNKSTLEGNITNLVNKIDNEIAKAFKKEG